MGIIPYLLHMLERFDSFSDTAFDADDELRRMKSPKRPEDAENERSGGSDSRRTEQLTTELQNNPTGFLTANESVASSMTGSVNQELRQYHLENTPEWAEIQSAMKRVESEFVSASHAIMTNPDTTPQEKAAAMQQAMESFAREIGGLRWRIYAPFAKKRQEEKDSAHAEDLARKKFEEQHASLIKRLRDGVLTELVVAREQEAANRRLQMQKDNLLTESIQLEGGAIGNGGFARNIDRVTRI